MKEAAREDASAPAGVQREEAAHPEPGSAEWHARQINRAIERDAAKLSRGSQRQGSAQSSRSSTTPGRSGLGSREGIRKGYSLGLKSLRASTAAIEDMLSHDQRAQTGRAIHLEFVLRFLCRFFVLLHSLRV